jgi:2-dehydropantoate 2-reductase
MVLEKPVAIVGLGALGSVFAALLARAGIPVIGVCRRGEHREALKAGGLLIEEGDEESRVRFPVTEELAADQDSLLVLVLVKSFDTEAAARDLAGRIDEHTPVLTLQNGLGNAEALAAHLAPEQVLAGVTTFGALCEAPGRVRLTGRGDCEIGAWIGAGERYLPQVRELLQRAGIECRLTANVPATLWKKLAVNAAINPLTTLLRVRNGELLRLQPLDPILGMIAEEVWRVAARHGIALPTPPQLQQEIRRVCQLTAGNRSSMLRDVEKGRRTEIEAINGAVARLGYKKGVLAPVNAALAGLIQALSNPPEAPLGLPVERTETG